MSGYAVSTGCTWWDSADQAADSATFPGLSGLPASLPEVAKFYLPPLESSLRQVCPKCGSRCRLVPNEAAVTNLAQHYEDHGHAGWMAFMHWCKGQCFPSVTAAVAAYKATGGVVTE